MTRAGVAALALVTVTFIVLLGIWAWGFLVSGQPIVVGIGVGLLLFTVIGAWGLWSEIWFGIRAEHLGRRLETEGGLPPEAVTVLPSGRVRRRDGDALFPKYRAEVETEPEQWRPWYRLGLVYDAAGDRPRAREAVRRAIRLERLERQSAR